jgi:hypothetical protein
MNPFATNILLNKFNHAYGVHHITKIRLHSNGGSQVKCVRKLSRDVDIASVIRCGPRSAGCSSMVWLKTYTRDQLWQLTEMTATVMRLMRWNLALDWNSCDSNATHALNFGACDVAATVMQHMRWTLRLTEMTATVMRHMCWNLALDWSRCDSNATYAVNFSAYQKF